MDLDGAACDRRSVALGVSLTTDLSLSLPIQGRCQDTSMGRHNDQYHLLITAGHAVPRRLFAHRPPAPPLDRHDTSSTGTTFAKN